MKMVIYEKEKNEIKNNSTLLNNINIEYVQPVNNNLICSICQFPIINPYLTPCGHIFCKSCIIKAIEESKQCPIDRKELKIEDLTKAARLISNILDELYIYCPNKKKGCEYTCQRQFLYIHINKCEYNSEKCPNEKCNIEIIKKNMENHLDNCEYKKIKCKFCNEFYSKKEQKIHLDNCKKYNEIINNNENERIVNCKYKKYGCSWQDKIENLNNHLDNCTYHQLKGFFEIYDINQTKIQNENEELKKKVYNLTDEIKVLKKELSNYKETAETTRESVIEINNETEILRGNFENVNKNLKEQEMRNIMIVNENMRLREEVQTLHSTINENLHLREEVQSLRSSTKTMQTQILSLINFIKEKSINFSGMKSINPKYKISNENTLENSKKNNIFSSTSSSSFISPTSGNNNYVNGKNLFNSLLFEFNNFCPTNEKNSNGSGSSNNSSINMNGGYYDDFNGRDKIGVECNKRSSKI